MKADAQRPTSKFGISLFSAPVSQSKVGHSLSSLAGATEYGSQRLVLLVLVLFGIAGPGKQALLLAAPKLHHKLGLYGLFYLWELARP